MFLSNMARWLLVVAVLYSRPQFLLCLGPSRVCQMHILSASWIKVPFFPMVDENHLMSDLRQNLIRRRAADAAGVRVVILLGFVTWRQDQKPCSSLGLRWWRRRWGLRPMSALPPHEAKEGAGSIDQNRWK